jgi:hypothetical protein
MSFTNRSHKRTFQTHFVFVHRIDCRLRDSKPAIRPSDRGDIHRFPLNGHLYWGTYRMDNMSAYSIHSQLWAMYPTVITGETQATGLMWSCHSSSGPEMSSHRTCGRVTPSTGPCHSSGFPPRQPKFEPGSGHVGFVVEKVTLGQVFSEYFSFPCQFAFLRLLHNNNHHLSPGASTIGQIVADVPSGHSLTP